MEAITNIGQGKRSRQRRTASVVNTGVDGTGRAGAIERLRDALERAWQHTPQRVKTVVRRASHPYVLLVVGMLTISALFLSLHYYNILSAEIDARLKKSSFDDSLGIFSSPFAVREGERLSINELVEYLHAAGYQQRSDLDNRQGSGSFSVNGNSIEITPGGQAASQLGLGPVRLEIGEGNRITSLRSLTSGKPLESARIEGGLLASIRDGDRGKKIQVHFSDIPSTLRNAVLAVEDRRFFTHSGIDWRGIGRAFWADMNEGEIVQGGSTITQQLIKNAFLTPERTYSRKLKEAAMAVILESRLSKEEIFTHYCNDVYLGHSGTFAVRGLAEAAQVYLDKSLDRLSLGESAFLAGLIHAPNRYSAGRDNARTIERRNQVLDSMLATGVITAEEAEAAKREPLQIKKRATDSDHGMSYFIDYVQRFVEERYGANGRALQQRIYTTMDPRLQRAAFESVNRHAAKLDRLYTKSARKGEAAPTVQAALVAMDAHTGEVLAMVGGRNYDNSQLNRATDARRQPGSTFKPFVYAGALNMRSYTAATLISDRPQSFSFDGGRAEYKPSNYHGAFTNRDVTLREALARSLNVPAVELAMRVGLGNIAELAEDCGLDRPRAYPSMALGTSEVTPIELAAAYTAFANEGMALTPMPVRGTTDSKGDAQAKSKGSGKRVFSPQVAYLMTNMMQSVVDAGTGASLRAMGMRGAVAGKTGTSNDGWFVGYTPNMVCVVWVGFDDNKDLGLKSSETALPIWADFVKQALELRPELGGSGFSQPGGIVTVEIDPTTGQLAGPDCADARKEVFISGTEPLATCSHWTSETDLVAELEDPPQGETEGKETDYSQVTLEVCSETGRLSSYRCPRTKRQTFDLGHEPLDMCRDDLHKKPDDGDHSDDPPGRPFP